MNFGIMQGVMAKKRKENDMPKLLTDPIVHNGELTDNAAFVLGCILGSWLTFRKSHDLKSLKIKCCGDTEALFEALADFEKLMMDPKQNGGG